MPTPPVCHTCHAAIAGYESVHYGSPETGYRDLCNRCFNEEVARLGGLNFEHVQFEPIAMTDAVGNPHRFHFRLRLNGEHVALDAFELKNDAPGGYTFRVHVHRYRNGRLDLEASGVVNPSQAL
jgi:hypothetical protein